MHVTANLEVFFKPPDRYRKFISEKLGLRTDTQAVQAQIEIEDQVSKQERGTFDFLDDRDRWQFLSKELAQKQELIHQVVRKTIDSNDTAKEKADEINLLKSAIMALQSESEKLSKQARIEDMIQKGFKEIPKEIEVMKLEELRKQLVTTAMSYKSEKLRNVEYSKKLNQAFKQTSRREEVI